MGEIKHSVQLVLEKFVCLLVTGGCGNQHDSMDRSVFTSADVFLVN